MKRISTILLGLSLALMPLLSEAKTSHSLTLRGGGSGPYKAVVTEDSKLEGYSIIRPSDMKAAAAAEGKLPVILFGNGGCARNSFGLLDFLTEVASHGYVIITNGYWRESAPTREQEQATMEAIVKKNGGNCPSSYDDAMALLKALDYIEERSYNRKSEFYKVIDTDNLAVSGQSCGGLQALMMGTSGDVRVKTVVPVNSGIFGREDSMSQILGNLTKKDLEKINVPVAYFCGGEEDIAYPNGASDYDYISHVPVVFGNCPSGHPGPYEKPDWYAPIYTAWMDWMLKSDYTYAPYFMGTKESGNFPEWTLLRKNF